MLLLLHFWVLLKDRAVQPDQLCLSLIFDCGCFQFLSSGGSPRGHKAQPWGRFGFFLLLLSFGEGRSPPDSSQWGILPRGHPAAFPGTRQLHPCSLWAGRRAQGTGCSLSHCFRIDTVPSVQSSPLDLGWPWGDQKLWDLSELSLPLYLDRVQETEAEGPPWLQEKDGNP